jgi:hypothetical protein
MIVHEIRASEGGEGGLDEIRTGFSVSESWGGIVHLLLVYN